MKNIASLPLIHADAPPKKKRKPRPYRQRSKEVIRLVLKGYKTPEVVAKKLKISRYTAMDYMRRLTKQGKLSREFVGVYGPPEPPKAKKIEFWFSKFL